MTQKTGQVSTTGVTHGVTPRHNSTLKLRIADVAFLKLIHMRDHKPYEVAMFGITTPDDPLFVQDFALVKQKVHETSTDIDPDGLADHISKYYNQGIGPINCERVWCHTHPMTGSGSANPSGKDMSTWNHADNSQKNLFVMMILSKSGEITCRVRIRGSAEKFVTGLKHTIDIDETISTEIVQTDLMKERIRAAAQKIFTPEALATLNEDVISKWVLTNVSKSTIFPEFTELEAEYEKLVTLDRPTSVIYPNAPSITQYQYGSPNTNRTKKKACPEDVPRIALIAGDDCVDIGAIKFDSPEIKMINDQFTDNNGCQIICNDLRKLHEKFIADYASHEDDICMTILGAIRGKTFVSSGTKFRVELYPLRDLRSTTCIGAGMFWPIYSRNARVINGFNA